MNITALFREKSFSLIKDLLICIPLLVVFAIIAFFNLGDTSLPKTSFDFTGNEPIFIDFGEIVRLKGAVFLNAGSPNTGFRIYS